MQSLDRVNEIEYWRERIEVPLLYRPVVSQTVPQKSPPTGDVKATLFRFSTHQFTETIAVA
jgi:hypothetical protein